MSSIPPEIRAYVRTTYAREIKAEADRGAQTCPLEEGSDAAFALRALVGNGLLNIARARIAAEQAALEDAA